MTDNMKSETNYKSSKDTNLEEFERYMQLSYNDKQADVLENTISYLNAVFPDVKVTYKNDMFTITGDERQSVDCRNIINETLRFSAKK